MDYQGNAKKNKEQKVKPDKEVKKVTTGKVIVQKKSFGTKFKDLFIAADFNSVSRYILMEVLIPAVRNLMWEASSKGIERMIFGERAAQRRMYGSGSRTIYNSPVSRPIPYPSAVGSPMAPRGLPVSPNPSTSRYNRDEFIIATREDANAVLEMMNNIIDQYEVASVADLYDLLGVESSHTDQKWGWVQLGDVTIRQTREGFLLDLPQASPI